MIELEQTLNCKNKYYTKTHVKMSSLMNLTFSIKLDLTDNQVQDLFNSCLNLENTNLLYFNNL
jgi:uncharacterized protein YpuA (DUF1002 family)